MTPGTPHSLFDRLFGGDDPRRAAELADALDRDDHDDMSEAALAAYLDGGLPPQDARLCDNPALLHDVASADAFMEAMDAKRETAPADLVAAALARPHPMPPRPVPPRPVHASKSRLWTWSGVALAMAAAVMAALVIVNRQPMTTNPSAPVTAQTTPPEATKTAEPAKPAPSMLPAVGEYTMPTVAKKAPAPAMAPAASMETVPPARR